MSKVTLTIGVSGSGKTYWAREQIKRAPNTVIVCRDDIRAAQGFPPLGSSEQESKITKIQRGQIEAALLDGFDVIVADTNLNKSIRNGLIRFCHKHGADVILHPLNIDVETCIERDSQRDRTVGETVIRKQHARLVKNPVGETYFPARRFSPVESDDSKPSVVVCDIDNTVASSEGIRSPYDYTRVHLDEPKMDVVNIIKSLSKDYRIVFLSGREGDCRKATEGWLKENVIEDFDLFMRTSGDSRPDFEVKCEISDEFVLPNYNVIVWIDDRLQVIRHVRARGVTVMDVAGARF